MSGGNPEGYLRWNEPCGSTFVCANNSFLVNYQLLDNEAAISFDLRIFNRPANGNPLPIELSLFGPNNSRVRRLWTNPNAVTGWMHFDVPLRDDQFSVITGSYAQVISGVWRVGIRSRIFDNTSFDQQNGFDNITLRRRADVPATAFNVTEGEILTGGLGELSASDDNRVVALSDGLTMGTKVLVEGTSHWKTPLDVAFITEAYAERLGLSQATKMYNYGTASWVTVGGRVATGSDVTDTFLFTNNASQWVGPNGEMKAEINWTPINDEDPAQDGWGICVDMAKWRVL